MSKEEAMPSEYLSTREVLKISLKSQWITVVGLSVFLFIVYTLYFGSSFQPSVYLGQVNAYVVDLDGGSVGAAAVGAFRAVGQINWIFPDVGTFTTADQVRAATDNGDVYFSVVINANVTASYGLALATYQPAYNPKGAWTVYYDESRAPTAMNNIFLPIVRNVLSAVQQRMVGANFATKFAGQNLTAAAYTTGVALNEVNLHPSTAPIVNVATTIGLLYLFIFGMIAINAVPPAVDKLLAGRASPAQILLARTLPILLMFPLMAIFNSITILMYNGVFLEGTFGGYFGFACLVLLCFLAINFLIFCLPPPANMLVMMLFMMLNVASAGMALPVELATPFYWIGYGLPMLHAAEGIRTIMFAGYNRMWLDCLVIALWLVFSLLLSSLLTLRRLRREEAERRADTVADQTKDEAAVSGTAVVGKTDFAADAAAAVSAAAAAGKQDAGYDDTAGTELREVSVSTSPASAASRSVGFETRTSAASASAVAVERLEDV